MELPACSRCGAPLTALATETVVGNRLAWALSVRCDGCGDATEDDGWDEPPDDVRAAIVARDGLVRVTAEGGGRRLAILSVFRRGGASIAEAAAAFEALTRAGVAGTPGEMRLLAGRLTAAGVTVSVRPDEPGRSAAS